MKKYLSFFILFCLSTTVWAKAIPVLGFFGGITLARLGKTETLSLIAPFTNTYKVRHEITGQGVIGLFVGSRWWWCHQKIGLQLNVVGSFPERQKISGVVLQFSNPNFDNFDFRYFVQSKRVMLQTQLMTTYRHIHPYLSFGLGVAFNKTSDYQETPRISTAVPAAPFTNHSSEAFAFSLGLGLNYSFRRHWEIGAGYQYANLGEARLGSSPVQVQPAQHIHTGTLHNHEILAHIDYAFNHT